MSHNFLFCALKIPACLREAMAKQGIAPPLRSR